MRPFMLNPNYYTMDNLDEFIYETCKFVPVVRNGKKKYFNVPAAFDIETSSFVYNGRKCAIMYTWQFGINGRCIVGRTWDDFLRLMVRVVEEMGVDPEKRLIVYVHNLSYEFQFMRKHFTWDKVFAMDEREAVFAICNMGIEFRCSYMLSGYSLAKLGDELTKYEVHKLVGSLDYRKIRHALTPITGEEMSYNINDILVVMAFIQETIERDGDIAQIPLTKTGYVRKYCREQVLYQGGPHRLSSNKAYSAYRKFIKNLIVDSETYAQLKRAFQGGFTHANAFNCQQIFKDVASFDFTSSYPAVMVTEEFPMSVANPWEMNDPTDADELAALGEKYCCLFDIEFTDIEPKCWADNPISSSKCSALSGETINNGRVVSARVLRTTMTEQDFYIARDFYQWGSMRVSNLKVYIKAPLPAEFVRSILKLYKDKTTLKGVPGKEIEYQVSKGMLNSCYGMTVTDIVREEINYNDTWETKAPNPESQLEQYNKDPKRFMYYPWGVWVTAYARRNLFSGILEFDSDYIYSDTDSIKVLGAESHSQYFNQYEDQLRAKLQKAVDRLGLPFSVVEPEDIKGNKHLLGAWDYEGTYARFKTLGAKRYIVEKKGNLEITVAGLGKKAGRDYLLNTYGLDGAFDAFENDLKIPKGSTGKLTHTYIDDEMHGVVTDYLGNTEEFHELSGVHLEDAGYELSMVASFIDYLNGIKTVER